MSQKASIISAIFPNEGKNKIAEISVGFTFLYKPEVGKHFHQQSVSIGLFENPLQLYWSTFVASGSLHQIH